MGIFVWAVRSQGLEPSAKCFCNMHELLYETKAMGKEQYHNNFGCYGFIARSNASRPVPTFRKRWPGAWMEEWFYVKNDLKAREDIKEVIMHPIWSRFGLRKTKVEIDDATEALEGLQYSLLIHWYKRFNSRAYSIQSMAACRKLGNAKETITKSSESDLVRLK
jgi:hypothetical protein